jgi:hypothetical protein
MLKNCGFNRNGTRRFFFSKKQVWIILTLGHAKYSLAQKNGGPGLANVL